MGHPLIPAILSVGQVRRETGDVVTLTLEGHGRPFRFRPGQFNMLYLPGAGEVPISISGDPGKMDRVVHTVRMVGSVTGLIGRLKRGDPIGVRGPFGNPWPVDEARGDDILLVAGGVGLAPLRPVVYDVLSRRKDFGRFLLLYGARTPDDLLYKRELHRWRGRFDMYVDVTVDSASSTWKGNVGVVTTLIERARFDPYHTTAMVCGPEVMMRFTVRALMEAGLKEEKIFLSMERNMKCAIGLCGHCQFGPYFVCKDGPVFRYDTVKELIWRKEV